MKVDGSLESLLQGVSQQPARTRLPGQCTAQENMSSNAVDGLTRRPPMEQLALLFNSEDEAQFYEFSLGQDKDFIVAVTPQDIRVFDTEGNPKVVNIVTTGGVPATDYLDGGDLCFTSLDGTTYIANRTTVVEMRNTTASYVTTGGIVYLLGGQYGRAYVIRIRWSGTPIQVSYQTPNGSTAADIQAITTINIAVQLQAALNADATFNTNFNVVRLGDVLYITKTSSPTTESFEITVEDGDGLRNIVAVNNKVTDVSRLPRYAPQGYVIQITGAANASVDDWYVRFDAFPDHAGNKPAVGTGFGRDGAWLECVAPNIPFELNVHTMPHILTYDDNTDEFEFSAGEWLGRRVGDEETNENPSFVGNTIEDLGYFQGRLVMLSGPAVIMSRTNSPLDFWLESATGGVDTDPIDIRSTAKGVRKLFRVIPYNRDLVIFADRGQFIVFGRNAITPLNSSLVLTTSFEADLTATPVGAGKNVFFGIKYGNYAGIQEFFTQEAIDANDSRPVTAHVLKYMRGTAVQLTTSSNFGTLIVRSDLMPHALYIYEYLWNDNVKIQSSWSRWTLPNPVVFTFMLESRIYAITRIGDNYYLNLMDLDIQEDAGMSYQTKLDRKIQIQSVDTEIVAPYVDMPDPEKIIFVQGEGCPYPGMRVIPDSYDPDTQTFVLKDDMQGGTVYLGIPYRSSYIPTMPFVKDADGIKIGTGVLVVSKFIIQYRETGRMECRIFSKYGDDSEVSFQGRVVGDPNAVVGQPAISDGSFYVPFRHNSDYAELEIYTESHLPMSLMDIEWQGQYTKKGRRISGGGS